jgi:hypothetical protein
VVYVWVVKSNPARVYGRSFKKIRHRLPLYIRINCVPSFSFRKKIVKIIFLKKPETFRVMNSFCFQLNQGCQMERFQTLGKFWRVLNWKMLEYFMAIWSIFSPFGLFYGHSVYCIAIWYISLLCIWYILWLFGIFFPFWYVFS